jgi:hypothetical protein
MAEIGTTLWIVGGTAAAVFLVAGIGLSRSGRQIPTLIDRGFQVLELTVMAAIILNLGAELLA